MPSHFPDLLKHNIKRIRTPWNILTDLFCLCFQTAEAKDRLSLSESKRKQSNPQKVVSPNTNNKDKDASNGEEELPEDECEEEKDIELSDKEWSKQEYYFEIKTWNTTVRNKKA